MADTKLGPAVESFVDPAKPAPTEQYVWAPEDDHPWTPAEDKLLRKLVEDYRFHPETPWGKIAIQANFGHNSGSCKARYQSLPKLKWADASVFEFAGAKGGGKVTASKKKPF